MKVLALKGTLRRLTHLGSLGSVAQLGRSSPNMPDTNRVEEPIEMYDLAVKLRTAMLYSIAQSLAAQFPPPEEPPPELQAILERLDYLMTNISAPSKPSAVLSFTS